MTRRVLVAAAAIVAVGLWAVLLATAPGAPAAARLLPGHCAAHSSSPVGADTATCINLNTAGLPRLVTLPGIGPVIAGRIMERRAVSGSFRSTDDLRAVKGIGPATVKKIHDLVCF